MDHLQRSAPIEFIDVARGSRGCARAGYVELQTRPTNEAPVACHLLVWWCVTMVCLSAEMAARPGAVVPG
jgi:hypothetical protein